MTQETDALAAAQRALDAGRPELARAALDTLSNDSVEVLFLRARTDAASGRVEAAQAGFDAVLARAPEEPAVWMELALFAHGVGAGGDVVRRAGRAGLAPALVEMVKGAASGRGARARGGGRASKRDLAALSARVEARDLRGVEASAAVLLKAGAGAAIWAMLGRAQLEGGQAARATEAFGQGLRLEPYAADLRVGLARALARGGGVAQALAEARRAVRAAPAWADAQATLARIALAADLAPLALEAALAAVTAAPRADGTRRLAAEAALAAKRPDVAVEQAAARAPEAPGAALLLGRAQAAARMSKAALATYGAGLDRSLGDADLLTARGQLLQSLGREAEADLRAALAARPGDGTALRALAYGTTLDPDDPAVAEMVRVAGTEGADGRLAAYAAARALEPSDPDVAFGHLARANAAMAAAFPHDPAADRTALDRALGPHRALLAKAPMGESTAAPIFVTGLPRSGTTLVEAILAAHPDVTAGGELGLLRPAMRSMRAELEAGRVPDAGAVNAAGAAYVKAAERLVGGAGRFTDKSIHSFVEIGAIRTILPAARIVVVHRDPRDTALSIWRNHFPDGTHRYAASAEGIADHLVLFREAVEGWRAALPGVFHEIAYEALLDDPEGEARRMLAACDLAWDPAVLEFHAQTGRVDTLSFAQVRQPIYRSSEGGWRRHAARIEPLLAALEARGLLPGG